MFRTWMKLLPYFIVAWAGRKYLGRSHDEYGGHKVEVFLREHITFYEPLKKDQS